MATTAPRPGLLTMKTPAAKNGANSGANAGKGAPVGRQRGAPGWLRRAVRDEDVVLFLLGVRWVSLLPPVLTLLLRDNATHNPPLAPSILAIAGLCTLWLSGWHRLADRLLVRFPWLLGIDLALSAAFLACTGGTTSPYAVYAYTPLLAAAFFFGMRGGAVAALALTAFYLIGLFFVSPPYITLSDALTQVLSFFVVAVMFGYPAVLLQRLKAAGSELQRAQEDVQRATTLATLGKTVAHVSHEIRNPLVTLGGFARHLVRHPDDTEKVRHHAQVMVEEISRLETLLDEVLEVARPPKLKFTRGNLHQVLDQACLLAGSSENGPASRVTIEKDYDPSLPWLRMNAPALLRAFLNISRNAMQAMPAGGVFKIATRYISERDMAEIIFSDNGPGIPDEIMATLYEPFVTQRENGTGLGLAIVHQIVHEHGGSIQAVNLPAGGAQFTLCLPLTPKNATD